MNFDRVNFRVTRLILGLALTFVISAPASADDTWHNVYHSLKHFFTGKSGSSPTPAVHHRAKHAVSRENTEEAGQTSPSASPSPSVSTAEQSAPSRIPSATPRVVVLPAATPVSSPTAATSENSTNPDAAQKSPGEQPTPPPVDATKPVGLAPKSESTTEVGPVLRSLSDQGAAASPTPTPR